LQVARGVSKISVMYPELAVDCADLALRKVVDIEDIAEAWMLEVEVFRDNSRTGKQLACDLISAIGQLTAKNAVRRFAVERHE